jgi:cell division protein FtsQ
MKAAAAALGGRIRITRPAVSLRAPSPRLRRRLLALAAPCLLLGAGYQLWLRDSSLVSVDDVQVTGLTTKDAGRVRAALTSAGHTMTTLHVDHDLLERAVAHYPAVRGLEVSPDFPHGLRIHVIEHHPAALVVVGGEEVPVAGDGTLLRGLPAEGRLPTIEAEGGMRGDRLAGPDALAAVRVAAAVPGLLRGRLERVGLRKGDGLVVELRDGPELIFGDASRARVKWIAAARVLADRDAAGATYIDLRLPGRPAAGGLPAETVAPVAPAGAQVAPVPGTAATGATTVPGAGATAPAAPGTAVPPADHTVPAPATGVTTPPATTAPPAAGTAPATPQAPPATGAGGAGTAAGGAGAPPG